MSYSTTAIGFNYLWWISPNGTVNSNAASHTYHHKIGPHTLSLLGNLLQQGSGPLDVGVNLDKAH